MTTAGYELVQSQVVIRHGARVPYANFFCWEPRYKWDCNLTELLFPAPSRPASHVYRKIYDDGPNELRGSCHVGQLVAEGYKQQQINGRHLRKAYVGAGKLFGDQEKPDRSTVYLHSDDQQRTVMSGQVLFSEMFPATSHGTQILKWHTRDMANSDLHPNRRLCPRLKVRNASSDVCVIDLQHFICQDAQKHAYRSQLFSQVNGSSKLASMTVTSQV